MSHLLLVKRQLIGDGIKKDTAITSFANDNKLRVFTPECLSDKNFLKDIENQNPDFFILFLMGKYLRTNY
ncbi:MAG: hypothetical protein CM15mP69_2330 [Ectothiorhodospiraceae bacterium]|nr:MAG: hypothetical protein CM15mP69_2330 [Ectothiorhodospiraceae bacterium]